MRRRNPDPHPLGPERGTRTGGTTTVEVKGMEIPNLVEARRRKLFVHLPGLVSTVDVGCPCPEQRIHGPRQPTWKALEIGASGGGNDADLHPSLAGAGFNALHTFSILP